MKRRAREKGGIIYHVKNKITGKAYIGATTNSIRQRKLDHEERAKRGESHSFAKAIATYGPDAFIWEQTDTASSLDELAKKEKEHIKKYNTKNQGYNADVGGGIQKTVYQYSIEDGRLLAEYDCLESAANAVGASKTSISNTCLGQNKTCKGYHWSYSLTVPYIQEEDKRIKKVVQLDLEGNQMAEFESVAEASRKTGISKTCISRCCRGERIGSGGFKWKYN